MKQVRRRVFETNSSSTHSITICTESEFDKWTKGELYLDIDSDELISIDEIKIAYEEYKEKYDTQILFEDYLKDGYKTCKEWDDNEYLENYYKKWTTPNGEKIVAFGQFGYDG